MSNSFHMNISLGRNNRRQSSEDGDQSHHQQQQQQHPKPQNSSHDGLNADPDYWQVKLPTDELDNLMWGDEGIPPPAPPVPKFQKKWARQEGDHENCIGTNDNDGEQQRQSQHHQQHNEQQNDNISSALDTSMSNAPPPPPPAPDKMILEDIVWKQRSGLGKYSLGILKHEWEQRRVVLFESGMLRYYALPSSLDGVTYDPDHAVDGENSPWVYKKVEPRGQMNLKAGARRGGEGSSAAANGDHAGESWRWSLMNLDSNASSSHGGGGGAGVKIQARTRHKDPGPTPFEIDLIRRDTKEKWRLCFISKYEQDKWLSALKKMAAHPRHHVEGEDREVHVEDADEDSDDEDDDDDIDKKELGDHGFEPGDHIIRWEMLPIVYPIQIHGIVLEAGKNCVIIADFGLASYDAKMVSGGEGLNTWSDDGKDDSHDVIMAAWEKIKPKEKKRLNVIVVTDPKEIRKWTKISYGDRVEDKKKNKSFFDKFHFGKSPKHTNRKRTSTFDSNRSDDGNKLEEEGGNNLQTGGNLADLPKHSSHDESDLCREENDTFEVDVMEEFVEGEPEWFRAGYKPRTRTNSSSSAKSFCDGQSVFSIDRPNPGQSDLPKSDSAKLVLSRTHFILENEDLLPPYHVFYSNSECIAVWCKTGRWSTLQAAVYLVSSSVGFGKSATMLTISVAAAHAILLPAVAVGGLAVVGAPLLFLKKSQEKWEKTTMKLTTEFWSRAPPEVFVEAIEYWGGLHLP